jgi:hypothetical protein
MRVARLERNKVVRAEVFHSGVAMTADAGKRSRGLGLNYMIERAMELRAESMT